MKFARITLADIARHAGVSRTAVSYALRDDPNIAVETRARIRKSAEALGYRPDPMLAKLMAQADLVVATRSRDNVKAAYQSGKPALGVGAGNVAAIVLPSADPVVTSARIATSKTFDHATSCSSENSLIVVEGAWERLLAALRAEGGVLATPAEKACLAEALFPDGRLSPRLIARPATEIARLAGLFGPAYESCRFILVSEEGVGAQFPFSGEKLSPVLTVYRVPDFDAAIAQVRRLYEYQGQGHSVGIHGANAEQQLRLGLDLPVCRVIVDQVHCYAVGGSFANGLPFSLSMGCGTWAGNSFSDNLNYRHFLNITRIVRPIPERVPSKEEIFGDYWRLFGK